MSYLCGLDFAGCQRKPALVCDGCGLRRSVTRASGMPFTWFLDRKKAPGWKFDGTKEMRRDWCPDCEPTTNPSATREKEQAR